MFTATEFTVREVPASPKKSPPSTLPLKFTYNPSDDGTDEHLLILLHGLGDTHVPFANLGKQLKLPQTATLSIRAPLRVPFLDEPAYQWYSSFDPLGDLLERPNPASALEIVVTVIEKLVKDHAWPLQKIHLFGFAQGGSVAAETALKIWREKLFRDGDRSLSLGSVVSVSGPLLSHPTVSSRCPTPLLVFHRVPPSTSALPASAMGSFRKGFETVQEAKMPEGEGMPRRAGEWRSVMRFWSEVLERRRTGDLYEVMTNGMTERSYTSSA